MSITMFTAGVIDALALLFTLKFHVLDTQDKFLLLSLIFLGYSSNVLLIMLHMVTSPLEGERGRDAYYLSAIVFSSVLLAATLALQCLAAARPLRPSTLGLAAARVTMYAAAAAKGVDASLMVLVEMLVGSAILAAAAALVRLAPCPLPFPELGLCPTRLGKTLAVLYATGHTAFPAALYLTRKWAAGTA